jgi:hypothetical protein
MTTFILIATDLHIENHPCYKFQKEQKNNLKNRNFIGNKTKDLPKILLKSIPNLNLLKLKRYKKKII